MKEKLANFWYHDKWHTLVALFVAVVILFITVSSCNRKNEAKLVAIYAGPHALSANETRKFSAALGGAGAETPEVWHYLVDFSTGSSGTSYEGLTNFDAEVQSGEALVFFVSPALYARMNEQAGVIVALDGYLPEGCAVEWTDDTHRGVRLASLAIASDPAFACLPDDTVVCLRGPVSVGALFRRGRAEERYRTAEEFMRALFAFVPESECTEE